tara:strand:- start:1157 stop:1372 length:216 start_codon:yes stop_codon:yes gene_type:complete
MLKINKKRGVTMQIDKDIKRNINRLLKNIKQSINFKYLDETSLDIIKTDAEFIIDWVNIELKKRGENEYNI